MECRCFCCSETTAKSELGHRQFSANGRSKILHGDLSLSSLSDFVELFVTNLLLFEGLSWKMHKLSVALRDFKNIRLQKKQMNGMVVFNSTWCYLLPRLSVLFSFFGPGFC